MRKNLGDDLEDAKIYYIPIGGPELIAKVMITVDKDWEHLSVSIVKNKLAARRRPTDEEIEYVRALLFGDNEIVLELGSPKNVVAMVEGKLIHEGNMICAHLLSPVNKSLSEKATIKKFFSKGNGR